MESTIPANKTASKNAMLLELQYNITRGNLGKIRGIWSLTVPYKNNLVATIRQLGGGTAEMTTKVMMNVFTTLYLNAYAKDKLEGEPGIKEVWFDGMINGTTRNWGPENETLYKRLYNLSSG